MQLGAGPIIKDVVLIGAGHAHVTVLRRFGMKPLPGVRFTLITRELHTPYSGMLPGLVAGLYGFDDAHIDTGPLARSAGARLYHDTAIGLDLTNKRVICRDRPPVPYDLVSLDIGSTPNTGFVPGAAEHAIPVKPISAFLPRLEALISRVCGQKGPARIALVGAGAGGVELLLSLQRRLCREVAQGGHDPSGLTFTLVSGSDEILPDFPKVFRRRFERLFAERGITIVTGARVTRVEAGILHCESYGRLPADEILWTTRAAAAPWLAETGLKLDPGGFVRVDACLRAEGRQDVFAAGDIAAFSPRDLPKSGVYAVRAGPVLADNIRRTLTGEPLRPFRPQREALYLVSTGERHAVGTRNGLVVEGDWVWRWKDWIDRHFMRTFNDLPAMPEPARGPPSLRAASGRHRAARAARRAGERLSQAGPAGRRDRQSDLGDGEGAGRRQGGGPD